MPTEATLRIADKEVQLPLLTGTEGENAIDVQNLRRDTGCITFDEGYGNTGSCQSKITFIDGENGILRYRGYPIEQLAEKATYLDVAYLLLDLEDGFRLRHVSEPEYLALDAELNVLQH